MSMGIFILVLHDWQRKSVSAVGNRTHPTRFFSVLKHTLASHGILVFPPLPPTAADIPIHLFTLLSPTRSPQDVQKLLYITIIKERSPKKKQIFPLTNNCFNSSILISFCAVTFITAAFFYVIVSKRLINGVHKKKN